MKARKKAELEVYGECLEEIAQEWEDVDDTELTDEEKKFRQRLKDVLALIDGKER